MPCYQVLAASQSPVQKKWFQGTADAVRQYLWLFENSMREGVEDFLILAGKHSYASIMILPRRLCC
jgi:glucose-1-phosphate adenylyltransferase